MKVTATIDNWSLGFRHCGDPYQPPEVGYQVVQGTFSGHANEEFNGRHCVSSRLESIETLDGTQLAITASGSRYLLKEMSDEYKAYLKDQVQTAEKTDFKG